jgi:hypothetical protein
MARGHSQPIRDSIDAALVEDAVFNQTRGSLCYPVPCIDAGVARSQLGPAPQTRPISAGFGSRRAREERAILTLRHLDGANRAAIDPGRRHAVEEPAIEARIA